MRNQCGKRILPAYPSLITTSKTLTFFRNAEMEQDLNAPLTRLNFAAWRWIRIGGMRGVEFLISCILWTESRWNRSRLLVLRMNRCEDSEQMIGGRPVQGLYRGISIIQDSSKTVHNPLEDRTAMKPCFPTNGVSDLDRAITVILFLPPSPHMSPV